MKDVTVPEDLSTLSDDDLTALGVEIREAAEALADDAATSDEALSEIERLVAEFDRVNGELGARTAKAAERADRAAAALSKIGGEITAEDGEEIVAEDTTEVVDEAPVEIAAAVEDAVEASDEGDDDTDAADDAADEAVTDDAVEATVEDAVETATEEPEAAATETDEVIEAAVEETTEAAITEDDVVETAVVEEAVETAATDVEAIQPDEIIPATTATAEFTEDSMSDLTTDNLTAARPEGLEPVTDEAPAAGVALVASNAAPGLAEGATLDNSTLALTIARKRHGMNNASAGSYERIVLATAQSDLPNKVGGGAEENFAVFSSVAQDWRKFRAQQTALVASGGNCAPLEPSYDFFRLAESLNPVESALPSVEAPRGGIRFILPPNWTDAEGGVRVTTEAEDAAGYPPTEPKPCVRVECPPIEECRVDAVSQCVTFGNLNYRVFPEQVEAFLQDLAVAFTATKEVHYLDGIDNASTAVTATGAYGATRSTTTIILAAAAGYRRRHHMSPSATLTLMLPSWMVEFIKVDMVNDHSMGLGFLAAGEAEVNAWLASMNLDVVWYYDSATGAGQAFADVQGAGDLNSFPTSVVGYLFAPGTFVRLDGGTLDVGIVRDSTLNGTNDLQIFSEQWVQVCFVGLESLRLEMDLCFDGTGPEPVTPLDCLGSL
jgi:hypothetical protein